MNEEEEESRRVVEVVAAHPVEDDEGVPVFRKILVAAGIIVVFAILVWAFLTREDTGIKSVPPALIGTWTSSDPEYSDRILKLTSDSITFGTGGTSQVRYSIIGVAVEEEGETENDAEEGETENQMELGSTYFVVHFRGDDGAKFRREIVLSQTGQSLYFRSQPHVVWTRLNR